MKFPDEIIKAASKYWEIDLVNVSEERRNRLVNTYIERENIRQEIVSMSSSEKNEFDKIESDFLDKMTSQS